MLSVYTANIVYESFDVRFFSKVFRDFDHREGRYTLKFDLSNTPIYKDF